jgi:hypothetical protein
MREYDLHRVITFHRLVKGAKAFKASLPDVIGWMPAGQRPKGKLWTDHVDGTMSAWERQRRLQRLGDVGNGENAVISNARCLTEGVDVPTLDGVAFIDPKRSEIDIAQAVGRAIRLADDKTIGTIVIPVFIDTDEPNPDVILADSAFKPVWDVLLALRAHDEDLAQQLDDLRRMLGRLTRGSRAASLRLPPKIRVDIPDVCGHEFARAFDVRIIEQTTASWEFWFGLLERFVELNGHARVPQSHSVDGYSLGSWVSTQRSFKRRGNLDAERQHRLDDLPGWTWDIRADQWEAGFSRLLDYVERHGYARVPVSYTVDGYKLGAWVNEQCTRHAKGILEADRERRLLELAGWTWDRHDDTWEKGYRRLLDHVERYGDARVSKSHLADGYQLGAWVTTQRVNRTKGKLDPDRQQRLQELPGWTWDAVTDKWEEGYRRLMQYVDANGDSRVPYAHTVDGFRLGVWVTLQRGYFAEGLLDADRQRRLQDLPGWTWGRYADMWEENFRRLIEYVRHNGDARVPKPYTVDGYNLGDWVHNQRSFCARGALDADRERRLQELAGWTWDPRADKWEEGYRRLVEYVERHGDARVPQLYTIDGYQLGAWVTTQRQRQKKALLDADRQRRLEDLPGWTWNARPS